MSTKEVSLLILNTCLPVCVFVDLVRLLCVLEISMDYSRHNG